MARLFSHDHPDLDRGSIVLVIDIDSLVGASCDFIFSGMTPLVSDRHKVKLIQSSCSFFNSSETEREDKKQGKYSFCDDTDLPHVEYVLLLV